MTFGEKLSWLARYGINAIGEPSKIRGLLGLRAAALKVHWFAPDCEPEAFPPQDQALVEPAGLLAVGGRATAASLLNAFQSGIFVCNQVYQPTKWWAPEARMVLYPDEMYQQKTLQRLIRNDRFAITFDQAFDEVVDACAYPRANSPENWVQPLADTYKALHRQRHAFSVEAWDKDGNLAGGVFGLVVNRHLSVESMFTRANHASKIALAHLCTHLRHWDYPLIDLQMPTPHLESLGCRPIPRGVYRANIAETLSTEGRPQPWSVEVKPADDGSPILLADAAGAPLRKAAS